MLAHAHVWPVTVFDTLAQQLLAATCSSTFSMGSFGPAAGNGKHRTKHLKAQQQLGEVNIEAVFWKSTRGTPFTGAKPSQMHERSPNPLGAMSA